MDKLTFSKEIYKRYNVVKRARNCFLYTKKGVRLTDLFQENGRAILGWDGKDAFTQLKNTLNRGVTGSFITEDKSRLKKSIEKLLDSDRCVFTFSSKSEALKAAILFSKDSTSVYKPWNPYDIQWKSVDSVIIEPPLPWTDSIYILAIKTEIVNQNTELVTEILLKQTEIPYPIQVGITRAIYNLIQALPERQEKDWFIYDTVLTKYWTRKGPYLYPKIPKEQYDSFILHCLDCGIVINPDYNNPSIVPFSADKGVFTTLKNKPFKVQ